MMINNTFIKKLTELWHERSEREQKILIAGGIVVLFSLFYNVFYSPLQNANRIMATNISSLRSNLVWLREQAEYGDSEGLSTMRVEGEEDSLVLVLEKSARPFQLDTAITQLSPGESNNQVRVVLEDVDFNNWARWIAVLEQQYGVRVQEATVERQPDPNTAEVRMAFVRGLP